jgi:hypothetical protein
MTIAEMNILGVNGPWVNQDDGVAGDRPNRQAARVRAGRASFLLYHGRDGHSTGFEEFDEMYRQAWEFAAGGNSTIVTARLARLNQAIVRLEMEHIGALCLSRDPSEITVPAAAGAI